MKLSQVLKHGQTRWLLDCGQRNGQRRRLFFRSEREAQAALRQEARALEAVGVNGWGRLGVKDRAEVVALLGEIASAGLTLREVWEFHRLHGARLKVIAKPLGEAVAECVEVKRVARCRPRYLEALAGHLGAFARGREMLPCHAITALDIEAWLDGRQVAPITKAGNLRRLGTLFAHAKRRGWVTVNPVDQVERVHVEAKIPEIFTPERVAECLAIVRAKLPSFLPWVVLAVFAGIRPEELDRLSWANVELERGLVTVDAAASKVRRRRLVNLHPTAVAWLRLGGDLPLPVWKRRQMLQVLRDELGLKAWPQDVLRHSAASYMLARDEDAAKVALQLGNSPAVLFQHYRELVSKEAAAAFWGLLPGEVSSSSPGR
jgi:site-specific recombinase XerD